MKLLSLAVLAFLFSFSNYAQMNMGYIIGYEFANQYDPGFNSNQTEKELLSEKNIKTRTINVQLRDGKNSTEIEEFDQDGNLILYQRYNHKNELMSKTEYRYNSNQQLIYVSYWYNNKTSHSHKLYDKEGHLTETRGYDSKGNFRGRTDVYGSNNKLLSTQLFEKDSIHPFKRLDYEYYEDNSIKSIRYFEKTKLKYTWSYECRPEGELMSTKSEDTSLVCIKQEIDSAGNNVTWRQELNKKGELQKVKRVTDKDGNSILTAHYNKDGIKSSETIHFKDGGYLQTYYDKKGNAASWRETVYNQEGSLILSSYSGNKWYYYSWNSYTNGLVSNSTYVSKKNLKVTEYTYTYFTK